MLDILARYDIVGAFWMTIQLSFWAALGSLVLGTILVAVLVRSRRSGLGALVAVTLAVEIGRAHV